ncbi:von Willebrand factor type A domain-containing protein, partial [Parachaetomium inaequale]
MEFPRLGIHWTWDVREPPPPQISSLRNHQSEPSRTAGPQPQGFGQPQANCPRPRFGRVDNTAVDRGSHDGHTHYRVQADNAAFSSLHDDGFLPPIAATVKAQLIHDTAEVTVTQLFHNDTGNLIPKASYTFPLPQGCTVTDFLCSVGRGRVLVGKVKPKMAARAAFNHATRRNETAGLLDQETPEIFTTTLGNIPARAKLEVAISYIALLRYDFQDGYGLITFTLPMYIAPRFGTPPPSLTNSLGVSADLEKLSIEVDVLSPEAILSVTCTSHAGAEIETGVHRRSCQSWAEFVQSGQQHEEQRPDPRRAFVRLPDTVSRLDRDFVVEVRTHAEAGLETPQACIEWHPDLESHKAVMLTIPPRFMLGNPGPAASNSNGNSDLIFIADRSGSMVDKMAALISAMNFFLMSIASDRRFNIYCFGDRFASLWHCPMAYSDDTKHHALGYVNQQFAANMGGTNLLPVLKAAVEAWDSQRTADIVVLTDGEVWHLDATLDFVKNARAASGNRLRFFSLGIGAAVSHALVEGIAKFGGGYAEVIQTAENAGWESRVVTVLKATLAGHIGPISVDLELDLGEGHVPSSIHSKSDVLSVSVPFSLPKADPIPGADVTVVHNYADASLKMMQSPAAVSTISPFLRNRIFVIYEQLPPTMRLTGLRLRTTRADREEVVVVVPIRVLRRRDTTIHKLAARALLGDLERGVSHMHLAGIVPDAAAVKDEGERLGCKWGLTSAWTSFYAVEDRRQGPGGETSSQDTHIHGSASGIEVIGQSDLGLLRPRQAWGRETQRLIAGLDSLVESGEETEDSTEEDSDSHDGNDFAEWDGSDGDRDGPPPPSSGTSGGGLSGPGPRHSGSPSGGYGHGGSTGSWGYGAN